MRGRLTGARPLLQVALKQDRKNIAPWIALISVLSASSVLVYDWVFPSAQSQQILQLNITANPAMALLFGKPVDLTTADGFNAWRAGALGAFFAGLMAIFIVVRNSRARVLRSGTVVFEGGIKSLRRFKDDVREVASGYECGIGLDGFNDIQVGDQMEFVHRVEVART